MTRSCVTLCFDNPNNVEPMNLKDFAIFFCDKCPAVTIMESYGFCCSLVYGNLKTVLNKK